MTERRLDVRPDLTDVAPYESPQRPARYRMNTNESPYPPPQEVIDDVRRAMDATDWNRYPDKDSAALVEALAAHTAWDRDGVWLAGGSNEVLQQLFLAFGGPERTSLTFEPTYSLHTLIPRITGTRTLQSVRGPDLEIDRDQAMSVVRDEEPDIVMLCSPNNPTGSVGDRGVVRELCAEVPLVVVDEAYIEFAGTEDGVSSLLTEHENLVITRTFSKAWSLAGARLGYLLAHPWVIQALRKVRLPYSVSSFAHMTGLAALGHAERTKETVDLLVGERERLIKGLHAMGIPTNPTSSNFVLFEVPDARDVWKGLLARGVLVRDYSDHPHVKMRDAGPSAGCLRVTAGLPEETDAFLDAMEEVVGAVATI